VKPTETVAHGIDIGLAVTADVLKRVGGVSERIGQMLTDLAEMIDGTEVPSPPEPPTGEQGADPFSPPPPPPPAAPHETPQPVDGVIPGVPLQ
jgi:hypothetical protein